MLFMPRHEMVEGHIVFTLSECVCVCSFLYVFPALCSTYNFVLHSEISEIFDRHEKTMCLLHKPYLQIEGQAHMVFMNSVYRL